MFLRVFHRSPPIQGLSHAPTHVSHHLRARRSLHVAPRLKNSATRDPVRYSCRLSQHSDARVRKEVPLSKMRTPYKILYTKDGTVYFICANHHAIQIDQESLATRHWSVHNKSCQQENLEKQDQNCQTQQSRSFAILVTIHTLSRRCRARKPACEEQNDRTSTTSGRLLVEDRSSWCCSWTKDWYSARQASISLPLTRPRSKSPSNRRPSRCSGAWSSPPMMIAGQTTQSLSNLRTGSHSRQYRGREFLQKPTGVSPELSFPL